MESSILIDGVDEHFNKHVEKVPISPSVTGEHSPEVWHCTQLGLAEVPYPTSCGASTNG